MKRIITTLFMIALCYAAKSQCGNTFSPYGDSLRLFGAGQTGVLSYVSGTYGIFYVEAGANYNISTCTSGNMNVSYDTQLTVYAEDGSFLAYNDDYCGLRSNVSFTPSNCGYAKVILTQYFCNGSGLRSDVTFTQNSNPTFSPIVVTDSLTNLTCYGSNNGSIKIHPTGGTRPYSYTWSNAATDSTLNNLPAGTYTLTIRDNLSCFPADTTPTIYTITQPPLNSRTQNTSFCLGQSYTIGAHTYTATGIYTDTLHTSLGCDSIVTTNLTVYQPDSTHQSNFICSASGYSFYGTNLTAAGTYYHPFTNAHGCDSTIVLHLTNHTTASAYSATACSSYTFNGTALTTGGTYTTTLTNTAGCDSIVTLNLTINQPSTSTITTTACNSYTLNGTTYTSSGAYTQNLTNFAGCDSILTLNLTINQPSTYTITTTACDSYSLNGTTYTSSGAYTQNLTNAAGCDSIITLNLTVNNSSSSTLTQTACNNYNFNGTTLTTGGTYTTVIPNAAGCDSTITLNLTINTVDVSVTQNINILTANATPASYQWIDCNNSNAIINAETNQTYTANINGSYAVIVTQNNCTDTSACSLVATNGITTVYNSSNIQLYPNPTTGNITLQTGSLVANAQLTIYNALGQIVISQALNSQLTEFSLNVEAGIYQVRVSAGSRLIYQAKLIKQ